MLALGVHTAHRITSGVVRDGEIVEASRHDDTTIEGVLPSMPAHEIVCAVAAQIEETAGIEPVSAIGVGVPGILRHGVLEESPNLPQLKGLAFSSQLSNALQNTGLSDVPVFLFNDADTIAAGIAAQKAELNRLIRVWTLGRGIGFGRYPAAEGVWEGGHMVVTLDPSENHCACGGTGHLEGIMGSRAMRLRFLDKEPEEVFALAKNGDASCNTFVSLWHRALAAATASCIHLDGPGEFFLMGPNSRFVDVRLLTAYLDSMVGMSALQGSTFAVVPDTEEIGIVGAAINAELALHSSSQQEQTLNEISI